MSNTNTTKQPYKPRWDRKERRIGFNLSKLKAATNLTELTNTERLMARLGSEPDKLYGVKIAAATRWCSTVYTSLTPAQIDAVVVDCRTDENLAALVNDTLAYFDKIAGYVHAKPTSKPRQTIDTGVFAQLNAA